MTIDADLGRSASGLVARPGFEALVAQLCQGIVGAVFCLEASREAIRTVFRLFDRFESARQVLLHMVRDGLQFPRPADGHRHGPRWQWLAPVYRNIIAVLRNPFYAGAYAYGTSTHRTTVVDGRLAKTYGHDQPMAAWRVLLRDHHAGYITWAGFEHNQERLRRNAFGKPAGRAKAGRGARVARGAIAVPSLWPPAAGRVHDTLALARYLCRTGNTMHGVAMCIGVGARRPDEVVAAEVLRIVEPLAVEAALAARDLAMEQAADGR